MSVPLFVRSLTGEEQHALEEATCAADGFTRRRAQILCFSRQKLLPRQIAAGLGCTSQTVRNCIHDFHEHGLESLRPKPKGPQDPACIFDQHNGRKLLELAHQGPRAFGKERSTWSLQALAEVSFEQGLTARQVSHETIRQAIGAMGVRWQRAKHWIHSPDEQYELKKSRETA